MAVPNSKSMIKQNNWKEFIFSDSINNYAPPPSNAKFENILKWVISYFHVHD